METLAELLALQYPFRAVVEPTGGWSIVFPDLPGCVSYAETWEEIGSQARVAVGLWLESELDQAHPIPPPTIGDDGASFGPAAFDVPHDPELLTARDVAAVLGVTPRRVSALAGRRGIGRRVGRSRLFSPADLAALRPWRPGRPPRQKSGQPE